MTYRALVHDTGDTGDRLVARELRDHGYEVVLTDMDAAALHIGVVQEDVDLVYSTEAGKDQQQETTRYGADPAWFDDPDELVLDWEAYDGIGPETADLLDDLPPFDPDPDAVEDRLVEEYGNPGNAIAARVEL